MSDISVISESKATMKDQLKWVKINALLFYFTHKKV